MLLSPHEQEKLLLHVAGQLARERRSGSATCSNASASVAGTA